MEKTRGVYLGTEIDEKWWKRFTEDKIFMRGNGEYWYDDKGFYFLRYLTQEPIFIPFTVISEIKSGKWHSGRWCLGNLLLKLLWERDALRLSSGFIVSSNKTDTLNLKQILQGKIGTRQ